MTFKLLYGSLALLSCLFIPNASGAIINLEPGNPAPGIFLYDLHGKEHFLSDYVGEPRQKFGKPMIRQPVLLNFFGVNCKPCEEEIPYLQQLAVRYQQEGLKIILISKDPKPLLQAYAKKHAINMTILIDEYEQIHKKYLISAIPVLYLIGPNNHILLRRFGFVPQDNAQLELTLKRLFKSSQTKSSHITPKAGLQ